MHVMSHDSLSDKVCSAYKLANSLPSMLFLMQYWLRVTNAPGTNQDVMKDMDNSLLFDVPGVESCMFGQAGQTFYLLLLLQIHSLL